MFACAARIGSLLLSIPRRGVGGEGSRIRRVLDWIALGLIEAEHGEAFFHVLRERRRHVNDALTRMGQNQATRQKMQLGFETGRNGPQRIVPGWIVRGPSVVFRIADDRMADL